MSTTNGTYVSSDAVDGVSPSSRAQLGLGIFGLFAPLCRQVGYSSVPIEPYGKRPLAALGPWDRLRTIPLTLDEIAAIDAAHPHAGLGVAGGFNRIRSDRHRYRRPGNRRSRKRSALRAPCHEARAPWLDGILSRSYRPHQSAQVQNSRGESCWLRC